MNPLDSHTDAAHYTCSKGLELPRMYWKYFLLVSAQRLGAFKEKVIRQMWENCAYPSLLSDRHSTQSKTLCAI